MKPLTLLIACMLFALFATSQSVLRYEFLNTLGEKNGAGPALTVLGNQGVFETDTLNEISGNTKTVYRFEQNSGFQFDNEAAGNFIGENYSIELYFVFDNLTSWKRVVDWKNRKSDNGAYVYYGELNFYPYIYSDNAPVLPGEYTYYVVTRDGSTGQVLIYADADEEIDFMDDGDQAVVDADNVINFFHDDLIVPNEASSGAVALLNLYNYILDSNAVKNNFENLGGQVFSVKENAGPGSQINVYPNPANGFANINLKGFDKEEVELEVLNPAGQAVYHESYKAGRSSSTQIDTRLYPAGIYLFRATSRKASASTRIMVVN